MRPRLGRSGWGAAVIGSVVALLLTGCTESRDDETSTGTVSPSASSDLDEGAATPDVAPATGKLLATDLASIRIPKGRWHVNRSMKSVVLALQPERTIFVALTEDEDVYGQMRGVMSLQELAENSRSIIRRPHQVKIHDEVTLDGVDFYHLSGPDSTSWREEYGTSHEGMDVVVDFEFPKRVRPRTREQLVNSVLATFEWR